MSNAMKMDVVPDSDAEECRWGVHPEMLIPGLFDAHNVCHAPGHGGEGHPHA